MTRILLGPLTLIGGVVILGFFLPHLSSNELFVQVMLLYLFMREINREADELDAKVRK